MERKKRTIPLSALMECDSLGESSEDSDFRIEDHLDGSNEEDASVEEGSADSEGLEDESDSSLKKDNNLNSLTVKEKLHETATLQKQEWEKVELTQILICCVCLGDRSNDDNEIVECDSCGVTVHEDCYGITDSESVSSSGSESSKTSWFCEACQAGKENPVCELCPNFGGIFKETDTGMWVHLVCALYIPGVAFRDIDKLSNVTLFEMSYNKWGKRVCSLCPDQQYAQTGVCIGCDAGLCRTYFHVTCAQREGLLTEAQSDEINHADPFYAHCKLHSNKDITKIRKRNWLAFESQLANNKKKLAKGSSDSPNKNWMKEKLQEYQSKYTKSKNNRGEPWIPTQKISRSLTSSASTLRALSRKANLSGIDSQALAMKEAHTNALADVHRKWHISPAFNVEYMGYYLDRNSRISTLKQNLEVQLEENSKLVKEQRELQVVYNQALKDYQAEVALSKKLKAPIQIYCEILSKMNLTRKLPQFCNIVSNISQKCSVSSRNNLDPQVHAIGSTPYEDKEINENLCLKCITCGLSIDQHLLVKCDTCQLYYHLGCLDPPLTRMPKKTKVMGWQCSECDKSSSDSDVEVIDTETPRQLRQVKGSWKSYNSPFNVFHSGWKIIREDKRVKETAKLEFGTPDGSEMNSDKQIRKEVIKQNQRNSSESEKANPQTIKQRFNLKTSTPETNKSVVVRLTDISCLNISGEETKHMPSSAEANNSLKSIPSTKTSEDEIMCNTCKQSGTRADIVTCDECLKGFHFHCLNPPVKKSPKARGYSWHCADCDPSESDSD